MAPKPSGRQHGNPDVDVGEVRPQQRRHERRRQDQQPAHRRRARLRAVRRRTLLADDLADLELAQLADQPRAQQQADGQRREAGRSRAERDVPRDVEHGERRVQREEQVIQHQAHSAFTRSATMSVRVPRDPFTSTTSPARSIAATRRGRLVAGREVPHGRRVETGVDGGVGKRLGGRAADGHEQVDAGGHGAAAGLAVQHGRKLAELAHLADHGDAAHGLGVGAHGVERPRQRRGARVVRVVDQHHALAPAASPRRDARRPSASPRVSTIASSGTS